MCVLKEYIVCTHLATKVENYQPWKEIVVQHTMLTFSKKTMSTKIIIQRTCFNLLITTAQKKKWTFQYLMYSEVGQRFNWLGWRHEDTMYMCTASDCPSLTGVEQLTSLVKHTWTWVHNTHQQGPGLGGWGWGGEMENVLVLNYNYGSSEVKWTVSESQDVRWHCKCFTPLQMYIRPIVMPSHNNMHSRK